MRILAIETTDKTGSVAVADDRNLLVEIDLDKSQRSAQSLAPALQAVLKQVGWQPKDVQLVATTVGPGSFTGLRVGVATAKVFAYAVGAEVLGIDTLETIAAAAPANVTALQVVMDAQRGDVVVRPFARGGLVPIFCLLVRRSFCLPTGGWLGWLRAMWFPVPC